MERRVISGPSSELTSLSDDRSGARWERDLEGDQVEYQEQVDDEDTYSDDPFEEDISDDEEVQIRSSDVDLKTIDLGNGIKLLVPKDCPGIKCNAEALSAEMRTETLTDFGHHHDEIMVSDIFELQGSNLNTLKCKPMFLQLPVVLPTTRLSIKSLFRFHVIGKCDGTWTEIKAEYEDHNLKFPVQDIQCFVAYARPIPEFTNVSAKGFTFVSSKDKDIRVEIPEGAVDNEMTISVKVHPVDTNRISWYRGYDPTAFEGIYALSDILSVRHNMENALRKNASVQLPIDDALDHEYEIKRLSMEHGNYNVSRIEKNSSKKGKVTMSYTVRNSTSCQASYVRPGIDESTITAGAMFQAGILNMCTILMYVSKVKDERYLTVEVVESPNAKGTASKRESRFFFEIINSRSRDIPIHQNKRVRIELAGNIQNAELQKDRKYTFLYSVTSRNNYIQFKTQKNHMGGMPYSIVGVLVGSRKVHEVHFDYPDAGKKLHQIQNRFKYEATTKYEKDTSNTASKLSVGSTNPNAQDISMRQGLTRPSSESSPSQDTGYGSGMSESRRQSTPTVTPSKARSTTLQRGESQPGYSSHPTTNPTPSSTPRSASSPGPSQKRVQSAISSIPDRGHPLLSEASLLNLAGKIPQDICQNVLIGLGMPFDTIKKVKKEAEGELVDQVFLLLLRWIQSQKGRKSDTDLIEDLEKMFRSKGRADIAEALKKVRGKGREFKEKDM